MLSGPNQKSMVQILMKLFVTKNGTSTQFISIARTRSQLVKTKVAVLTGKVESKKYPKAV